MTDETLNNVWTREKWQMMLWIITLDCDELSFQEWFNDKEGECHVWTFTSSWGKIKYCKKKIESRNEAINLISYTKYLGFQTDATSTLRVIG